MYYYDSFVFAQVFVDFHEVFINIFAFNVIQLAILFVIRVFLAQKRNLLLLFQHLSFLKHLGLLSHNFLRNSFNMTSVVRLELKVPNLIGVPLLESSQMLPLVVPDFNQSLNS